MPRSKRETRASGVGRSLRASRDLLLCLGCRRLQPRDAIAYIGKEKLRTGHDKGKVPAYCGKCLNDQNFDREDYLTIGLIQQAFDEFRRILMAMAKENDAKDPDNL